MSPTLEFIVQTMNYGDLPEVWRVPEVDRFSTKKTLYDYQVDALKNAARALYLYYGKEHDWSLAEPSSANDERKQYFYGLYGGASIANVKKYETRADKNHNKPNPVFRILSPYIRATGEEIPYRLLINRLCFWMATGSGKTLVMVKLIAYLHSLIRHGEIPPHNLLILAPSDHLLGQIRRTVEEFNQTGLHIELVPLRDIHRPRQWKLGDSVTVYYHRSDNLADVQKDKLTDYRTYENDGHWYVLLDEAHKGGKDDSKRQAYYAVMARAGFLFNFSATFTETEDIATTVKKYNLEAFIKNGHGKNIYLNENEYTAFQRDDDEINPQARRQIVLQSLLTLALVSERVNALREQTDLADSYHRPLMLTLVNSVNTVENDLLAFFQTLREIASGDIDEKFFKHTKDKLIEEWKHARLMFSETDDGLVLMEAKHIRKMTIAALRKQVFNSKSKGAIQVVRGNDKKELALQIKNAAAPFALIRIGDTAKWRNEILAGYEETTALQEKSFFDELERSDITILMGSRSFFESWDSNRPNVINFINIGGLDAKKFVVQSVGRGVRIEPLPGKRRRISALAAELNTKQKALLARSDLCIPPETLFLFATNRKAIKTVLDGLEGEKQDSFEKLEGFERAPAPLLKGKPMPLLIPVYREGTQSEKKDPFALSQETLGRFQGWLEKTSDSVFAVRDGLALSQIQELHTAAFDVGGTKIVPGKHYGMLAFLQERLLHHLSTPAKESGGVREIDDQKDIVHFRQVCARSEHVRELKEKISRVKQGKSRFTKKELAGQLFRGEIDEEQFDSLSQGKDEEIFKNLTIKKILNHYYLPVVLGDKTANYIRHIIKVKSEIKFLEALEQWLEDHKPTWDGWLFSKLDEAADDVHIPYYDWSKNEQRRFFPDFIFWMCKGDEYRIVFVDPKGNVHRDADYKIEGYMKLFLENDKARRFQHGKHTVSVHLFYYNPEASPPGSYKNFWIDNIAPIFAG